MAVNVYIGLLAEKHNLQDRTCIGIGMPMGEVKVINNRYRQIETSHPGMRAIEADETF